MWLQKNKDVGVCLASRPDGIGFLSSHSSADTRVREHDPEGNRVIMDSYFRQGALISMVSGHPIALAGFVHTSSGGLSTAPSALGSPQVPWSMSLMARTPICISSIFLGQCGFMFLLATTRGCPTPRARGLDSAGVAIRTKGFFLSPNYPCLDALPTCCLALPMV